MLSSPFPQQPNTISPSIGGGGRFPPINKSPLPKEIALKSTFSSPSPMGLFISPSPPSPPKDCLRRCSSCRSPLMRVGGFLSSISSLEFPLVPPLFPSGIFSTFLPGDTLSFMNEFCLVCAFFFSFATARRLRFTSPFSFLIMAGQPAIYLFPFFFDTTRSWLFFSCL